MEKILESFMNKNEMSFSDFLEEQNIKNLYSRDDYKELIKKRNEIYNQYPDLRDFIENEKPISFDEEKLNAFMDIFRIYNLMNKLIEKEAFKLGSKECYLFMKEMNLLKN